MKGSASSTSLVVSEQDRDWRRVLAELADVRARLTMLEATRSTLSPDDRDTLARILPAVAGALGSELWTVRQLRTSEHAGVRVVLEGIGSRRLGKLFARCAGMPIGGYVVERIAVESNAVVWQVRAILGVRNSGNSPTISRSPGGRVTV